MRIAAVLALVVFLGLTAPAAAAPFAIGPGTQPAVAVDAAGTAYIAWNGPEVNVHAPRFCRLPRGASVCDVAQTLPVVPSTDTVSRPFVHVVGARVSILVHRYGEVTAVFLYQSVDGGLTFTRRVVGGNVPIYEAAYGPGDGVSLVTNAVTAGGLYQRVPLDGGTATAVATLDAARPYDGVVALDGGVPIVSFSDVDGDAAFRRYSGTGDVNVASNWSAPAPIGRLDYPRAASGAPGVFGLSGDGAGTMLAARWTGAGFAAPVAVGPGDSSESHLAIDGGGRLHAVFPSLDANGYHARHAVSDDGASWTATTLADAGFAQPQDMRVAAAPDHLGVAAWEGNGAIEVAAIGVPVAAAPPPPAAPPPTPTPVPEPIAGKTVVVTPSGTVRLRLPGGSRFVDLSALDDVPMGSTIDTKRGAVVLRARNARTGLIETVRLSDGWFKVSQAGRVVDFTLNEPLARCPKRGSAAQKKPRSRKLWGDGKGSFRTSGKYSAATVRGTRWLVQDTCAGTTTRVTQGSVTVTRSSERRTVIVRAGQRYTVRAPR